MTKSTISLLRFCIILLLTLPSITFAVSSWGQEFEFSQPDGSKVTVRVWGDEYYRRMESLDGYTVIREKDSNWICYADISADEEDFISTGYIYDGQSLSENIKEKIMLKQAGQKQISFQKGLKLKPEVVRKKVNLRRKSLFGDESMMSVSDPENTPASGPLNVLSEPQQASAEAIVGLTLLIDFPDVQGTISQTEVDNYCNQIGYTGNGNNGSIRDFFYDVSGGLLEYTNVVTPYIRANNNKSYYDTASDGARELIKECLQKLVNSGFDLSSVSKNGTDIVALNVLYAGSAGSDNLWPHRWVISSTWPYTYCIGDVCALDYQITNMGSSLVIGTFCHENGHMLCDWPDLYDYGYESEGCGEFCLMGSGNYLGNSRNPAVPDPYLRFLKGWENLDDITNDPAGTFMTLSVNPLDDSLNPLITPKYTNLENTHEYFLIENIYRVGRRANMPDEGLLIWHIDEDGSNENEQMTPSLHYKVSVEQADGLFNLENGNNRGDSGDLFDAGSNDSFTDFTVPDATWWNGNNSGLSITDISDIGYEMTFFNGIGSEPIPYYPLNGNFNDASGSGYSAIGYNFSGTQWSTNIYEGTYFNLTQSVQFDGIDDYVVCPTSVGTTDNLTVAFWINPENMADMIPLDKFPANANGAGWSIQLTQDGRIAFQIGSQSNYTQVITANSVYEANRWAHIACTFTNGTAKVFVNGALRMIKKGITQSVNTTAVNVRMGIPSQVNTDRIYQGFMDDVRFYDIAMEPEPLNAMDGLNFKPDNEILAYLKLDENNGTLAENTAGRGTDALLNNGLSFDNNSITGPVDKALSFDGTDDYISLSSLDKYNNGFTVALWAYPTAVKNWARFIDLGNGEWAENILFARYADTNNLVFEGYDNSGSGGYVIANNAIALNQWQFFAATVDVSGNVKLYKDGQVIQTGISAALPNVYRSNLYIGRSNWSSDSYYQGGMDDIRIYNYPLSDAEILDIYQNSRMDGPIPYSGNNNISPEVTLQFTPAGKALRHDIYFGTEYNAVLNADIGSPEYVGRKEFTRYNPPSLESWQEYFWRVDELISDGTVQTGPVWRFSTVGSLQRQVWTGLSGANEITALTGSVNYPDNPSLVTSLDTFEIPTNWAENYGTRVQGLLVPRTSGSYQFWISGDNEVELWLSSDANPANISQIAYIHGTWSGVEDFDQHPSQQSPLITLQAGQAYYIMALHKEGDGGDHMAVAWQGPDSPVREIIDGYWLRPPAENEWPYFNAEVSPSLDAVEGLAFSENLPITASDPDFDSISYFKQKGPDWITVSSNGQLSGTPGNGDVGSNTLTIRAFDSVGDYDDMLLPVNVANRFTGSMGLDDLSGFAQEWLSSNPNSEANLDQFGWVNLEDFSLLTTQWQTDIIDGLIAHWTLDDAYGLTARDNYAQHDGVLNNMTEYNWAEGHIGGGLSFDGSDDYIEIPDFNGISSTASRTCTAWIKTSKTTAHIMGWGTNETSQKWLIRTNEDGTLRTEVQGGYIYGVTPIADNDWHHIAVVLIDDGSPDISEVLLYIDGQLETVGGVAPLAINTAATETVKIGVHLTGLKYFEGLIDDIRIYNRALNDTEISELAQ